MQTLNTLRSFGNQRLANFPAIQYTNLFRRISSAFHFEFIVEGDKFLFSPYYTLLRGAGRPPVEEFVKKNESFLDSLKEFIINTLYLYNAIVEENAYYLTHEQDIIIGRLLHRSECRFEVKFYAHVQEELLSAYNDKIYLGRTFVDLQRFERENFGLNDYFLSIIEQNTKIQERARHKLRYYEEYRATELEEIDSLAKEVGNDALERLRLFPNREPKAIPTVALEEMLDNILYIQNLMIELRDVTQEFENKLRQREENSYAKYLTKFSKDLINDIKYLTKLYYLISNKICRTTLI